MWRGARYMCLTLPPLPLLLLQVAGWLAAAGFAFDTLGLNKSSSSE